MLEERADKRASGAIWEIKNIRTGQKQQYMQYLTNMEGRVVTVINSQTLKEPRHITRIPIDDLQYQYTTRTLFG